VQHFTVIKSNDFVELKEESGGIAIFWYQANNNNYSAFFI
jgi:hypothetical protein